MGGFWLRVVLQQASRHIQMVVTEKQGFIFKPNIDPLFGSQPIEENHSRILVSELHVFCPDVRLRVANLRFFRSGVYRLVVA
ncbi:hypothetical protein BDD30_1388 [Photorhabdus asymbiotica]|uniref:Uncharacterized protein n=1 Tax=Photorhabdus asymbiotica TaxID=291112 RepID=A0ABX9SMR7_9GAMM|nr:hypothetical protein BDD30_1388 [Photorhabdus asymbiotica]